MKMQVEEGGRVMSRSSSSEEELMELRRGPWTVEEDFTLINYIAHHGEGRWNSLACSAGLKRTGKSCRLRWLNYLRPDVRRGNISLQEQLLILELHSRWGNRWSKIAQHLPGRTDNEIKNYWRTRVQKHAKQLKCDVNSKQFKDTMRYLWMPRLVERIQAASNNTDKYSSPQMPENSSAAASSSDTTTNEYSNCAAINQNQMYDHAGEQYQQSLATSPTNYFNQQQALDFEFTEQYHHNNDDTTPSPWQQQWMDDAGDNFWTIDDIWFNNSL